MAYISGRAVHSSHRPAVTTRAATTRDTHRLAVRHLDWAALHDLVTIHSTLTADPATLAGQVRTAVTFPRGARGVAEFADALAELPGVVRVVTADTGITVIRNT